MEENNEVKDIEEVKKEQVDETDEKYEKIQTEKLVSQRKKRRIITICGMAFAFVLAVCLIVLAVVPINLSPKCLQDDFYHVTMFAGTSTGSSFYRNAEEDAGKFAKFNESYKKSFSQTCLTALFSGSLFSYDIQEGVNNVSDVLGEMGNLVGSGTYFVRLRWTEDNPKTVVNQSGKKFLSGYRNSSWDGTFTFTEAYFVVNKTAGLQDTKVYIVTSRPSSSVEGGSIQVLLTITVKADTNIIYQAWDSIVG